MRQSYLILSNATIIWVTRVLILIPQLLLIPFLLRTIGNEGYGIYTLLWSLILAIEQLEKSLQSGVIKHSAALLAREELAEANAVVSSSFVFSLLLAVLASSTILLFSFFYESPAITLMPSLLIVAAAIMLALPLTPYLAVIQSRQRYYVGAIAETVSKYLSLCLIYVWFWLYGPSVEATIAIMCCMLAFSRIAQIPAAYALIPGLKISPVLANLRSFRLIASFGVAIVVASFCIVLNTTGIRWMMGTLVSPTFVAHLALMLMPGLLLSQIVSAMTVTIMPAASAYEAAGNVHKLSELFIRGVRYTTIIACSALLTSAILLEDALELWVGADYTFLAPHAFALLAGACFLLTTSTAHHMLKGLGKLREVIAAYFMGLVVVPGVSIPVLLHLTSDPYVAAVAGLTAGNVVCAAIQVFLCSKVLQTSLNTVLLRAYLQPLSIALLASAPVLAILLLGDAIGWTIRLLMTIVLLLCYFYVSYRIVATLAEKQQVKDLIRLIYQKLSFPGRVPPEHQTP